MGRRHVLGTRILRPCCATACGALGLRPQFPPPSLLKELFPRLWPYHRRCLSLAHSPSWFGCLVGGGQRRRRRAADDRGPRPPPFHTMGPRLPQSLLSARCLASSSVGVRPSLWRISIKGTLLLRPFKTPSSWVPARRSSRSFLLGVTAVAPLPVLTGLGHPFESLPFLARAPATSKQRGPPRDPVAVEREGPRNPLPPSPPAVDRRSFSEGRTIRRVAFRSARERGTGRVPRGAAPRTLGRCRIPRDARCPLCCRNAPPCVFVCKNPGARIPLAGRGAAAPRGRFSLDRRGRTFFQRGSARCIPREIGARAVGLDGVHLEFGRLSPPRRRAPKVSCAQKTPRAPPPLVNSYRRRYIYVPRPLCPPWEAFRSQFSFRAGDGRVLSSGQLLLVVELSHVLLHSSPRTFSPSSSMSFARRVASAIVTGPRRRRRATAEKRFDLSVVVASRVPPFSGTVESSLRR